MTAHKIISQKWNVASMLLIIFLIISNGCDIINPSDHSKAVFTNAVTYNEYLASEHDYPLALKMLDTLSVHAAQNIEDITLLAPFKNDSSFKEAAIDEFNFYNKTFVNYSREIIAIKMKIDSGTAINTDYNNYNACLKKMKRQSAPIESRLEEIQKRFAKKNNIELTVSEKEIEETPEK